MKPCSFPAIGPLAFSALTLAACASAPAAAPLTGPVAGKWSVTVSTAGMVLPPQDVCFDQPASLDDPGAAPYLDDAACSEQSYTPVKDGLDGHSVCTIGETTMRTTTRVRGDFASRYTVEMTTTMIPALEGVSLALTRIDMERIGDC